MNSGLTAYKEEFKGENKLFNATCSRQTEAQGPKRMHVQNQDGEKTTKRGDDFPIGKVCSTGSKKIIIRETKS